MTVEELIAREEIRQVVLRHFRAADRVDEALERGAFWPDGHYVGGPVHGAMEDAIPGLFGELLGATFEKTCHYITNLLVTVDGDRGFVECYGVGYQLVVDDPAVVESVLGPTAFARFGRDHRQRYELLVGVRYAVVMERRAGEWRILTMEPIVDWTRAQVRDGTGEEGLVSAMAGRGRRDRSDPSYFGAAWAP